MSEEDDNSSESCAGEQNLGAGEQNLGASSETEEAGDPIHHHGDQALDVSHLGLIISEIREITIRL